jgi:hypothetical protein
MADYAYLAVATLEDGTDVVLDLEEQGWADKELLAKTRHWALSPKPEWITLQGKPYPFVSISIPEGAKPIFRSRVFVGNITGRSSDQIERKVIPHLMLPVFRTYCIGWKKGRTHVWTWVLPDGSIEVGTGDDSRLGDMMRKYWNTQVWEEPEPEPEETEPQID